EALKDETHLQPAELVTGAGIEVAESPTADANLAGRWFVERAHQVQQRALATPGWSHDERERSGRNAARQPAEHRDFGVAAAKRLGDFDDVDHGSGVAVV